MPAFRAYGDGGCLVSAPAELSGMFCRGAGGVAQQQRKRSLVAASAVAAAAEYVRASKKARQPAQPSLDALPDECLFEVLRRLPGARERADSACVSRRWLALLASIRASELGHSTTTTAPSLPDLNEEFVMEEDDSSSPAPAADPSVERVLEGNEATDIRLAAMAVVAGSRGGLERLAVRGSHPARGVTDQGLLAVARGSPNLRSLALWNVPLVTDAGLAEIAAGCPELERLDITSCPLITDKGLAAVAQGCPDLLSLTVESCSGVGNDGLRAVGRCCARLQALSIKNCARVCDQGISSLVCSAAATLAKIRLQGLNITDASLAVIGYYGKAVTDLTLARLAAVGERGFWVMANANGLQNLRCISVTSCPGVTDLAIVSVAKFCLSLKQLCLKKCEHVSDAGLKAFAESAKLLENLQLEECNRVTLVGVLACLVNCSQKFRALSLVKCTGVKDICAAPAQLPVCKSLRFLTIKDCPGFTDASLAVVGMICPQLEQVDLSGLGEVTDSGLLPLITSSESGLVKVDFSGCKNITDVAVSALVKAHGKSIKQVSLEGCSKITDASLFAISENCAELGELDLSSCMISDSGIASLAAAKQFQLRVLSLFGCTNVTQRSVPFLGNMGKLEGLNLQFCNMIGDHSIASLEKQLWWCDILA
ncbi:hypothetical protein QYE76_021381 [Lolium multiflorum]|uniref:F-box/LRR-repeat protein 15-like leucin rich repeat domain-containing protein n=1 Tax=Lolium multiflorum TaxID=4521 RepID=A0AAD8R9F3_LOLMU|nr:hypothetical protein QYE76_021381 [Lolium multiflorum]